MLSWVLAKITFIRLANTTPSKIQNRKPFSSQISSAKFIRNLPVATSAYPHFTFGRLKVAAITIVAAFPHLTYQQIINKEMLTYYISTSRYRNPLASCERMVQLCRQRHLWGYRSRTPTPTVTLTLFLTLTWTLKLKEKKNDTGI